MHENVSQHALRTAWSAVWWFGATHDSQLTHWFHGTQPFQNVALVDIIARVTEGISQTLFILRRIIIFFDFIGKQCPLPKSVSRPCTSFLDVKSIGVGRGRGFTLKHRIAVVLDSPPVSSYSTPAQLVEQTLCKKP